MKLGDSLKKDCVMNKNINVPMIKLLGGRSMYKAKSNPNVTDKTETAVAAKTKPLKDETHFFAASTGITSKAPIKSPPMVLIPTQTTIAKIQKYKRSSSCEVRRKGSR